MFKSKSFLFSLTTVFITGSGLLAWLFLWLGSGVRPSQAAPNAIWYVNAATGDDANSCQSTGAACQTIAAAVAKAANDDTIQIAAGTYLEHDIEIFDRLTLIGAGAGSTIVDGSNTGRVFYVSAASTISGVTIQNGATITPSTLIFDVGGGAVFNGSSLTIQDSVLVNNSALGSGGAIFTMNGALIVENTEILSNTAEVVGGGIYGYNSAGAITVTNSLVAGNTAVGIYGGGIDSAGPLHVSDSTIRDNSSASFGGGLHINNQAVLENVTLTGNQAASGAAIFAQQGTITLTNVTVSENTASNNHGGIYLTGPGVSLYLQNSTIANNHRTNAVGTGFSGLMIGNNASVEIVNTIFAGNDGRNCGGTTGNWTSLGYNLSSDFYCAFTQTGDQQGVDPLLGPLADNGGPAPTHALLPGSPAIDAGTNSACPASDQRGVARPYDGDNDSTATCDVGAYEAQHQLIIDDMSMLEGNGGAVTAVFTVTLTPDSSQTVTVDYATANDSAAAGSDYTAVANTLTFNPGQTSQTISVPILGDTSDESNETFFVNLSNPANAEIQDSQAVGTIIDDDGLPALTISDEAVLEGNSGTVNMVFNVTLSPASTGVVTVDYATVNGSAVSGSDYTAVANSLTFAAGETSQQITVPVTGDNVDEGSSETFTIQLSGASNANIDDAQGSGTITDDDTARLSQTVGPQVLEGDSGTTAAVFTISLSTPAAFVVTVDYEVNAGIGDSGAVAGVDFVDNTGGTLTYQPGETSQTFTVQVIGDVETELDEVFSTLISNANVPISVNGGIGHILNDDDFKVYLPSVTK
jgi:parallel beta-helix repeat protein